MATNSNRRRAGGKACPERPAKPRPDLPLYAHKTLFYLDPPCLHDTRVSTADYRLLHRRKGNRQNHLIGVRRTTRWPLREKPASSSRCSQPFCVPMVAVLSNSPCFSSCWVSLANFW